MDVNSSTILSALLPIAIISPILVFRMRKMQKGGKVSAKKTIAMSALLLGISITLTINTFSLGVSTLYVLGYAAIFGIIFYCSYQYSNRLLDFWRARDGTVYVKGGSAIFIAYFISVIARISISALLGYPQGFTQSQQTVSSDAILAATVFDAILIVGVALLIGRNARILTRHNRIKKGLETIRQLD
jgi:hypothetical protein